MTVRKKQKKRADPKAPKLKRPPKKNAAIISSVPALAVQPQPGPSLGRDFKFLFASWLIVMAGLLSLPCFNLLFYKGNPFVHFDFPRIPRDNLFGHLPAVPLICLGFGLLAYYFRKFPPLDEGSWDLSKGAGRFWFWVFMGLGAYFRLENPHQPPGYFWDDHYTLTADVRNILDYHDCPFMFWMGTREPFHSYMTAFLWILLPQANGHFIMLFSDSLIDMAALWIFYLIGKEIGGRRMGILLLALGSTCKFMIMVTKFCYDNETCVLAGALSVLFLLRTIKKPSLSHFLEWGLALGFGGYTYVPFRPWLPVMLGVLWLWVYSDPKERRFVFTRVILGPFLLAAWAVLFLYKNTLLNGDNIPMRIMTSQVFLAGLGFLFGFSYLHVFINERKKGFSKLLGWSTGALAAAILMAPFYLYPNYSQHVQAITAWNRDFCDPGQGLYKVWRNIVFTWDLFLGQTVHPSQIPSIGDSLYEFLDIACALLALAYFLARPSWLKGYIVLLFLVSATTPVLSNGPHSFRYVLCSVPILTGGAWGLNRLWTAFLQTQPGGAGKFIFVLALAAGLAWEMGKNHGLIWDWMGQRTDSTTVWDQAEKELPDHRVYLVPKPRFYNCSMDILSDGEEIFEAGASNSIDMAAGEKGKDLAILVWGQDVEAQKKLEAEFPGTQWGKKRDFFQWDNDIPHLFWTEIPFDRVPEDGKAFIHVRSVPGWTWRRRWYDHYGLGRGLILYEDRVARWNENLPSAPLNDWKHCAILEGNWEIQAGGSYSFEIKTRNIVWFDVDGKRVLTVPPKTKQALNTNLVKLPPGLHHVKMTVYFGGGDHFPDINVTVPGATGWVPLDELVERAQSSPRDSKP